MIRRLWLFKRTCFLLLLLWIFSGLQGVSAQSVFGKITNEKGEGIPFVRVFVENTRYGAITDNQGLYRLEMELGSYTLSFQHLNYKKESRQIELVQDIELNLQLTSSDIQMGVIEIEAGKKDPAYAIMAQVIKNKKENLLQFETYICDTYQKIKLETDTLLSRKEKKILADSLGVRKDSLPPQELNRTVAKLIESQSTIYFKSPSTYKTVVNAFRDMKFRDPDAMGYSYSSVNYSVTDLDPDIHDPYLFYTDVSDADINFYRNLIHIPALGDRPYISPLNSTVWRLTYKYKLEETFYEEGRVNYRISLKPRNQDGPYFKGQIWIEDGTWAIKKVELDVLKRALAYYESFLIKHRYDRTQDRRRILAEEEYIYEIKEGRTRFHGTSLAMHSNFQIDVKHPKNFFKNELRRTEMEAMEKDSAEWENLRPFGLSALEKSFVHKKDSINKHLASPEYKQQADSGYNHVGILDVLVEGITHRDRINGMDYYIDPLLEQVQPLGVGGYRHALGGSVMKTWKRGYKVRVGGSLDYGFVNKDLKGDVNVQYTYLPRKFARLGVRFGDNYTQINNFATIQNFFSRGNFLNKVFFGATHRIEVANGWLVDVAADFADYKAIDNLALAEWSQSLFGENNTPESFDPFREFFMEFTIRYTPGQKYQMEPYRKVNLGSKWPTFRLRYKKAIPNFFGSEIDFDFLELGLDHEFKPGVMGISRWTVRTGRFLTSKNARFTDFKFFRGSDPYLFISPLLAFQSLGPTISTKNAYFRANYIHDFSGVLMDKIPLLKRTALQSAGGAGILLIEDGSFFHSEVYGGLQYPMRIRRQRFKVGVYFVTAYSNQENAIDSQVKVGVSFYNDIKRKWDY